MTPIPLLMRTSYLEAPFRACRVPFFAWVHHVEEVGKVTPNNDLGGGGRRRHLVYTPTPSSAHMSVEGAQNDTNLNLQNSSKRPRVRACLQHQPDNYTHVAARNTSRPIVGSSNHLQ